MYIETDMEMYREAFQFNSVWGLIQGLSMCIVIKPSFKGLGRLCIGHHNRNETLILLSMILLTLGGFKLFFITLF